ncbi:PHP domain-containing protein [Candidatus Actinomarina sp.]|nr:PHP domain-containing protein [Candidatus Actinomarina sp.]
MSIDLHLHSENSDGTDSPESIIEKAIEIQLEAISITDHEYLTNVPTSENIEIIKGVEVSVSWEELEKSNPYAGIHLLFLHI